MVHPAYKIANRLPPRPDPQTGQPWPPQAPWSFGTRVDPDQNPYRQRRLSHKPTPPPGRGPVLAWHKENPRFKLTVTIMIFSILVIGMSAMTLFQGDGAFDWMRYWQLWLFYVCGALVLGRPGVYWVESVGADWFQRELVVANRVVRRRHVNIYELTDIYLDFTLYSSWHRLRLRDGTGGVRALLRDFKFDPPAWDLVFLGIVHSLAHGARINERARRDLMLETVRSFLSSEDEGIERMLSQDDLPDEDRELLEQVRDRAHAEGRPMIDVDQLLVTADLTDAQIRAVMHHPEQQDFMHAFGLTPDSPIDDFHWRFPHVPKHLVPPADEAEHDATPGGRATEQGSAVEDDPDSITGVDAPAERS